MTKLIRSFLCVSEDMDVPDETIFIFSSATDASDVARQAYVELRDWDIDDCKLIDKSLLWTKKKEASFGVFNSEENERVSFISLNPNIVIYNFGTIELNSISYQGLRSIALDQPSRPRR